MVDLKKLKDNRRNAVKHEKHHAKRQKIFIEKDNYARELQPINKIIANNALAKFCENTSYVSLKELPCAVCSRMFSSERWTKITVGKINLSLLKVNKEFKKSFFEINYMYEHPCIDKSGCKILLDRNRFIRRSELNSKDPYDLQ
ncbi:18571_t:CDS:2, partial [Racocetra persica]